MAGLIQVAAQDIATTRYLTLAAITALVYDHALTIGDEISLVWPAKLGLLKGIYLFNRYIVTIWIAMTFTIISGHATFLNNLVCRNWILTNLYIEIIAIQTTSFVVAARVFDIWKRPRTAFLVLGAIWLTHCVLDFVIVTKLAIRQSPHIRYEPLLNICFADVTSAWTGWLNSIVYHALVLILLTWIWASTPRSAQTPFMKLIVRDGFIYFILIFTAMLFNLLIWRYGRPTLAALPYWAVWATCTHAISRMLLSMGSVQSPSEWGQRASIALPSLEVELGTLRDSGPKQLNIVSSFYDVEIVAGHGMKSSALGKLSA